MTHIHIIHPQCDGVGASVVLETGHLFSIEREISRPGMVYEMRLITGAAVAADEFPRLI